MFKAVEVVKEALENDRQENKAREIDYGPGSSDDEEEKKDGEEDTDSEEERKYYAEINRKILEKAE
jgi:hypothetical protein